VVKFSSTWASLWRRHLKNYFRSVLLMLSMAMLAACASGDVTGQKLSASASMAPFSTVDVMFMDKGVITEAARPWLPPSSIYRLDEQFGPGREVRNIMTEARDAVRSVFAARGIPGQVFLASDVYGTAKQPSHAVRVSFVSANSMGGRVMSVVFQVSVLETSTNQLLWQGSAKANADGDGFTKQARQEAATKLRLEFAEGIVRALRDSGLSAGTTGAKFD
jgi:hypothetical protein